MDTGLRSSSGGVVCCVDGECMIPEASWHGTPGGYTNHSCRCAQCTSSWADYQREGDWHQRYRQKAAGKND